MTFIVTLDVTADGSMFDGVIEVPGTDAKDGKDKKSKENMPEESAGGNGGRCRTLPGAGQQGFHGIYFPRL